MSRPSDIREEVAGRIVDALRRGAVPWRRPWSDAANAGSPANAVSGRSYRGVNALLLGPAGYASRWWATYAQVQALGGRVRKGERASRVVYWREVERTVWTDAGPVAVGTYPLLRTYCVFNVAQADGLDRFQARPRPRPPVPAFDPAEAVIAASDARIEYGGDRAVYLRDEDAIRMPPRDAFKSRHEFYATLFHELIHWTGHPTRLDRPAGDARSGDERYAVEELVAEVGGCFVCSEVGVPQSDDLTNHAAYLATWLAVLGRDATAVFAAAAQASRAADFLLSPAAARPHGSRQRA